MNNQLLTIITKLSEDFALPVYLVGGAVRDFLLNKQITEQDLDFVVSGKSKILLEELKNKFGGTIKEYPEFLTAKLIFNEPVDGLQEIDFAEFRKETYKKPGALPEVSPGDLESDLQRRDFTMNALMISVADFLAANFEGTLIDRFNGLEDLNKRLVRVLHKNSFLDDPTRIFRAARYKCLIVGNYEEETRKLLQQAIEGDALASIKSYRVRGELKKIAATGLQSEILEELGDLGCDYERYSK